MAPPLADCRVFDLPTVHDRRGNLTFIEADRQIPFPIKRVYYLYDVPGGSERGGHAHKELHQFIVALAGSFDVTLSDGGEPLRFTLNRSHFGLHICPMIWRELDNFSTGAVCLVLASDYYDEDDYIYGHEDYLHAIRDAR